MDIRQPEDREKENLNDRDVIGNLRDRDRSQRGDSLEEREH